MATHICGMQGCVKAQVSFRASKTSERNVAIPQILLAQLSSPYFTAPFGSWIAWIKSRAAGGLPQRWELACHYSKHISRLKN